MTPENLARIAAARTARELSDLARQAVGTTAADTPPAERLHAARRLRQMVNDLVDYTVLAEALAGTPWTDISAALNRREPTTVEQEFASEVQRWRQLAVEPVDMAADAEALDAWYAWHREDSDPAVNTPVSDLLQRD